MATSPTRPDPWRSLATLTAARIGLGACGWKRADTAAAGLSAGPRTRARRSTAGYGRRCPCRPTRHCRVYPPAGGQWRPGPCNLYRQRPDLGRILGESSRQMLEARAQAAPFDCALVVADGLSARAVMTHAVPLLTELRARLAPDQWRLAPVALVTQGRVAIGDEIGALLPARMTVLLIGERPGLSSPDSLGVYLTYDPLPGRSNAERNCISNIRPPEGLPYAVAAHKLAYLMHEARRRQLSGVSLKEDAPALPPLSAQAAPAALPPHSDQVSHRP